MEVCELWVAVAELRYKVGVWLSVLDPEGSGGAHILLFGLRQPSRRDEAVPTQ
jgi:hypothetical protein